MIAKAMDWTGEFLLYLSFFITVFPLTIMSPGENPQEDMESAIEVWIDARDKLLTMTGLNKFLEAYMAQEVSYLQQFMALPK